MRNKDESDKFLSAFLRDTHGGMSPLEFWTFSSRYSRSRVTCLRSLTSEAFVRRTCDGLLRGPTGPLPEHPGAAGNSPPHQPVLGFALHRAGRGWFSRMRRGFCSRPTRSPATGRSPPSRESVREWLIVYAREIFGEGWSRNRIVAATPRAMKSTSTTSCVALKGASVCVGARASKTGIFKNACTTPTKTLR